MQLNHPDSSNQCNRLFHISEQAGLNLFKPRPSPSHFENIAGDVVFAISNELLHNYLLPRDCPRITYYATEKTTERDKEKFFGKSIADYIVIVESGWYKRIAEAVLYCYEFSADNFLLIDACAGYYVSYKAEIPIGEIQVNNIMAELLKNNIELRFTPSLIELAGAVAVSSLNFSLIRMRNARL